MKHTRIEYGTRFFVDLDLEGRVARVTDRASGEIEVIEGVDPGAVLAEALDVCRREVFAGRLLDRVAVALMARADDRSSIEWTDAVVTVLEAGRRERVRL